MPRLRALTLLLALALSAFAPAPAQAAPRSVSAEEVYALGLKYLRRGYFTRALEQFNRVRTFYRDDPYSLKAELAIAEIHFKKNEWDEARLAYEDFMRAHPRYPELDLVVYRLGLVIYKKSPIIPDRDQTWTRQTASVWAGFGTRFPESEHRPEVERYLGKVQERLARKELTIAHFYARRNSWPSVVGRTEGLLRTWPTSPDRGAALTLLGVAQHNLGNADAAGSALKQLESDPSLAAWSQLLKRALARPPSSKPVGRTG
jgi:outer membrane protein assembly factor BamD